MDLHIKNLEGITGRPTKTKQIEIQRELRKFFDLGITATLAAEKTGFNIKTVCKYFEELSEQLQEQEDKDFVEQYKKDRLRIINSLDMLLLRTNESLDLIDSEIQSHIKAGTSIPRHVISQKQDIMRFMFSVIEKKGTFSLQPTVDETIKKKTEAKRNDNT